MTSTPSTIALAQASLSEARSAMTAPAKGMVTEKMKKAADSFEAQFISQMMQPMFQGISTNGLFGGGYGEETFRSLLIDEYAKMTVKNGGIGLSKAVQDQMLKSQEV